MSETNDPETTDTAAPTQQPETDTETPAPSEVSSRTVFADSFDEMSSPQMLVGLGAGIALLLGFMSWYSFGGMAQNGELSNGIVVAMQSNLSVNGFSPWHGKLFFGTSLATALIALVPGVREAFFRGKPQRTVVLALLILAGASFFLGPLLFLLKFEDVSMGTMFSASKTIWFWCALVASGAAVFGAFKLLGEPDPA